ncbi:putative ribonuclease H-like domain-containing protein [Tanacetum coccineum]
MFNKPSFAKINFVKSTEQVKYPRKKLVDKNRKNTPSPRGSKRNWNQQMSQKLGSDFEMFNKACHVCGSFDHLKNDCNNWYNNGRFAKPLWTNVQRVNKHNFSKLTHLGQKRNMVPRIVLTRSGPISLNTARPVNTVQPRTTVNNTGPMKNVNNNAYLTARRPFNKITVANNNNFTKKINSVKGTKVNTTRPKSVLSAVKRNKRNAVKASACWVWRPKHKVLDHVSKNNGASMSFKRFDYIDAQGRSNGQSQQDLKDKGVIDSGFSRHMTRNRSYLTDYKEIDGGFVAFGGNSKGGKITGKGKIRTGKLDFEDVYFIKELKFNIFNVSQMCDKKNIVLFIDTECVVLSPDFKLTDESHVLLKVPRKDNMYNVDLKNVIPQGGLTCLCAKATPDESNLWHRRLGHVNFKTMNKLVRGNLVRGLPSKILKLIKPVLLVRWESNTELLDETSEILKTFITSIENLIDLKVKVIRCDNGTEFKNKVMNQLCEMKGIKKEFSVARTPQQNGVAERKNRTLIEDARTMLADSKLPTTFLAEAVNTACYVQNRVLVIKPQNKTPYELSFLEKYANVNNTNNINTVSPTINATSIEDNAINENIVYGCADDLNMPKLTQEGNPSIKRSKLDRSYARRASAIQITIGARIEAIRLFLAYTSYKDFMVYQMDVKSTFLYGKIEEEVYVCQPLGKLTFFLGLQVRQKEDGIFISQDKFQVNPKVSHLHAVKRIFRYLKGQPKLGLWYHKDSPFDLVAYTDSDYAGASLDRKSTTGGCQFLGCRLISWQCKKQTVVANSTTEAEYIAASNCCGQVLWIQNQLLDYGYNFMQTKIHIDNESTICIVKNPIFHSKTKHIEIRHHFIRDSNEKKLIQMIKIHTDQNVADLLTKAFDRIIHKGWLEWNAKAAKDGIGVKTGNSRVNVVGHYLVLLGIT